MILSPDSWHHGVNDFVFGEGYSESNTNLCEYFWFTIVAIFGIIPIAIWKILPKGKGDFDGKYVIWGVIIFNIVYGAFLISQGKWWGIINLTIVPAFILSIPFWGEWFEKRDASKPPKPEKEHRPSMTWEYLKGKKGKYCPRIEWK